MLVGGLAVAGLAACAQKPVLADPAEPVSPVNDRIEALQKRNNAKIGVYAVGLPEGWTIADKTGNGDYASTNDVGIAYGPDGRQLLLSVMTRSSGDDPKAPNNRPLIGELATLLVPWLLG